MGDVTAATTWPKSLTASTGVVLHAALFQKLPEFLFEGPLVMMLFPCGDILPHRLHPADADPVVM